MIFLYKLIFNNFLYKIISLVIAVIIWYIVDGNKDLEITNNIPITINYPKGHIQKINKEIIFKGPKSLLYNLKTDKIFAKIYLKQADLEKKRYVLNKKDIKGLNSYIDININDPVINLLSQYK